MVVIGSARDSRAADGDPPSCFPAFRRVAKIVTRVACAPQNTTRALLSALVTFLFLSFQFLLEFLFVLSNKGVITGRIDKWIWGFAAH
jgi:hypothetical protein